MPKSNGFRISKDIYKRGNGRWAKVSRQHVKVGGVTRTLWKHHYHLCFGQESVLTASSHDTFSSKKTALFFAKHYIETGATTV